MALVPCNDAIRAISEKRSGIRPGPLPFLAITMHNGRAAGMHNCIRSLLRKCTRAQLMVCTAAHVGK